MAGSIRGDVLLLLLLLLLLLYACSTLLTACDRLENESKPRVERGKTVVDSTDDLSTEKERTLGFLKRVVGADGSVKLDKDKVVRKLKSNDEATRHKAKLGGVAKKMASGALRLRAACVVQLALTQWGCRRVEEASQKRRRL